ncbi:MAG TPA: flap endonuclease-1 [Candidatus Methanomethylophilaceae archaeon]|nr:flap endonuclease-1 [Candidatus Methanomethylophilaceae archaeon]
MGINFTGLTEPTCVELADLNGKSIAIDAYNTIYQFLSSIRQADGRPLSDKSGRVTSHLSGILYRTANLIEAGIEPSFVFDGKPHELKTDTLDGRRERREKAKVEWEEAIEEGDIEKAYSKAQQTSRMTSEISSSSVELLEYLGLPVIYAPSDGEAQCAYMCSKGDVWASASQDFDSLLFGAPILVRNVTLTGRRKVPGRDLYREVKTEVIHLEGFLNALEVTREQLVDVAILMGTDFNPGIKGIGPKRGLKLIKDHGDIEHVLSHIGEEIPEYQEIRDIFLDGPVCDDYDISPGDIDRAAVVDLLKSYDFSEARVEGALDRIDRCRETNRSKRNQRTLDSWF